MIRRHLFSLALGLVSLIALLLGSGQLAQALKPHGPHAIAVQADNGAGAPEIANFNLGDCLRETDRRAWPQAYALICTELSAAGIDEPAAPRGALRPAKRQSALPAQPQAEKIETARAEIVPPIPIARPARSSAPRLAAAPPLKQTAALIAPPLPACLIDEQGGTTMLDAPRRKLPPQIVSQRARGRTVGVALLVPAACGVKSPLKAKVLYAGDFKGYRGVVILGLTSKRRLIVAGLGALRVKRGDMVERGAILGATLAMGAPALVTAFNADMNRERSLLFFDLRSASGASKDVYWLADAS
jgi:hypothetical protein